MATYTKETALYDTGAISSDIQEAGAQVNKYITAVGNDGIKVHPYNSTTGTTDTKNYTKIDANGMEIYQNVNGVSTKVADFDVNGTVIGNESKSHSIIDADGQRFYAIDGATQLANIGYAIGQSASQSTSTDKFPYYTFGIRASDSASTRGNWSFAEGYNTTASGYGSHAEGGGTIARGMVSHAEGGASYNGDAASTAANMGAHAEGLSTKALGMGSHAEGYETIAHETAAHAEGSNTITGAYSAHAEGSNTTASGYGSHAEGHGTITSTYAQHVEGKYNIEDSSDTYAHIIGNGEDEDHRSNALAVDWNGMITIDNHSSPIGTVIDAYLTSAKSVAKETGTELCNITLDKGTWLCICGVRFPQNTTGYRRASFNTTKGSSDANMQVAPVTGSTTQLQFTRIFEVSEDGTKYYLNAYHSATTSLTMPAGSTQTANYVRAIRIL